MREQDVSITVVIAVRNMEATLERAIESVLNQTHEKKELIVMDGGSTDGSVDVIRRYADRLAWTVSGPDRGPSDAIAKALPHAHGELIGFLGADDWYEPDALALAARTYARTGADLCYGNMMTHDGEQTVLRDLKRFRPDRLFTDGTQWLGAVCAFVRKELLEENYKKENNVLLTDYLFFMRLYAEGRTFAHTGETRAITHFSIGGRTTSGHYRTHRDTRKVREQFLSEYPRFREAHADCEEMQKRYYVLGLVSFYMLLLKDDALLERVKSSIRFEEDCVLFGAGVFGTSCAALFRLLGVRISAVVDNDKGRQGDYLEGVRIRDVSYFQDLEGACVIVTPGPSFAREMLAQLQALGVDRKNRVTLFSDIAARLHELLGDALLEDAYEKGLIR